MVQFCSNRSILLAGFDCFEGGAGLCLAAELKTGIRSLLSLLINIASRVKLLHLIRLFSHLILDLNALFLSLVQSAHT